jgi:hypothetical protein
VEDGLIDISESAGEEENDSPSKRPRLGSGPSSQTDVDVSDLHASEEAAVIKVKDSESGSGSGSGWSRRISLGLGKVLGRVERDIGVTVKGAYRRLLVRSHEHNVVDTI